MCARALEYLNLGVNLGRRAMFAAPDLLLTGIALIEFPVKIRKIRKC